MMSLMEINHVVQGQMQGENQQIEAVSIDSRQITTNALFVAIKGAHFDGHEFVANAVEAGASAALVEQFVDVNVSQIKVDDCTQALGEIASKWRARHNLPVVGITGSNGKTTVTAMLAEIFKQLGDTLAPKQSFNNHWGVPLTLLQLKTQHKYAVIEMGMNHFGEIDYLTRITQPTIALINNIATAHIEGLGSKDNIAKAKQEIFNGLVQNGSAVLNLDEPYHQDWAAELSHDRPDVRLFYFGWESQADLQLHQYQADLIGSQFDLCTKNGESVSVTLHVPGKHNASNALAAAACAYVAGVSLNKIARGLSLFSGVEKRVQIKSALNDAQLIDDSFNANPGSMCVGLDLLAQGKKTFTRTIAVLGNMAELGEFGVKAHQQIGEYAAKLKIDLVFALQEDETQLAKHYAVANAQVEVFESPEKLVKKLITVLDGNTLVLVKGSKSARMHRIVEAVTETSPTTLKGEQTC